MSDLVTIALILLVLAIIIIVLIGLLLWRLLPRRKVSLPKLAPLDPLMTELAEPFQTIFDPRPNQYEVMLKRLRGWGRAIAVINIFGAAADIVALPDDPGAMDISVGSVVVSLIVAGMFFWIKDAIMFLVYAILLVVLAVDDAAFLIAAGGTSGPPMWPIILGRIIWAAILFNTHHHFRDAYREQPLPPGERYARRPALHILPPLTNTFGCVSAIGAAALLVAFFGGWIFSFAVAPGDRLETPLWWLDAINGVTLLAMLALSIMIAWAILGFGMMSDVDVGGVAGGVTVVVVTGLALYGLHRPFQVGIPPNPVYIAQATNAALTQVAAEQATATQAAIPPTPTSTPTPIPWRADVQAVLRGSDPSFGQALALSGDTLMMGAPTVNAGRGWLYIFRRDESGEYHLMQELPGPSGSLSFGRSVGFNAEVLVVGSVGEIHVYEPTGGAWQHSVSFSGDSTQFGEHVAVGTGTVFTSALYEADETPPETYAVYAYHESEPGQWIESVFSFPGLGDQGDIYPAPIVRGEADYLMVVLPASPEDEGAAYILERFAGLWQDTQRSLVLPGTQDGDLYRNTYAMAAADRILFKWAEGNYDYSFYPLEIPTGYAAPSGVTPYRVQVEMNTRYMLVSQVDQGRVIVFRRDAYVTGWTQTDALQAPPGFSGYGLSIAGDDQSFAVRVADETDGNGAVLIYDAP